MTNTTPRFLLPFILPGQAQKEQFHNEALATLDAVVHPAVEGEPLSAPPSSPEPGHCWIVGAGATGAWRGHDHALAAWTEGGWRFIRPKPGMIAWDRAEARHLHWNGEAWVAVVATGAVRINGLQVVGARRAAVPSPSGGTVIDAEARAAVTAVIAALMSHGLIE